MVGAAVAEASTAGFAPVGKRKLICVGGYNDGKAIKESIDTNYRKGVVWWKDVRIAEWDAKTNMMILSGDATAYEDHFKSSPKKDH